jgi:hypothetical protein
MNNKNQKILLLYIFSILIFFSCYFAQQKYNFLIPVYFISLLPITAFIYGYFFFNNAIKQISKKVYTSRLTVIYKYYFPITYIAWVIIEFVAVNLNFISKEEATLNSGGIFFEILVILLLVPFTRLKVLFIVNKEVVIYNYKTTLIYKSGEITKIKQVLFLIAIIEIERDQVKHRYIFMPPLDEFWYLNYFRETNSVKEIKAKIFN